MFLPLIACVSTLPCSFLRPFPPYTVQLYLNLNNTNPINADIQKQPCQSRLLSSRTGTSPVSTETSSALRWSIPRCPRGTSSISQKKPGLWAAGSSHRPASSMLTASSLLPMAIFLSWNLFESSGHFWRGVGERVHQSLAGLSGLGSHLPKPFFSIIQPNQQPPLFPPPPPSLPFTFSPTASLFVALSQSHQSQCPIARNGRLRPTRTCWLPS